MASTELTPITRNGSWAVRITWPNGKVNFFGQFLSEREAIQWSEQHRWLTYQSIDSTMKALPERGETS